MESKEIDFKEAIRVLKDGGIVIFPTDTAFGIGCRIDDEKAVERLFKIRKRPLTQATPVLIDSIEIAKEYVKSIPSDVKNNLIKKYWPGALTLIVQCNRLKVPELVRGGGSTIGIRIPNHPIALKLIEKVGVPILGPSANFHGEKTPYKFEDLNPKLIKLVDYVVPGECSVGNVSTVIDCSMEPWKIIRQGAIVIQNSKIKMQNYNSKVKNRTILFIDTSDNQKIKVGLEINGKIFNKSEKIGYQKAQIILPMIDKILKENRTSLKKLNKIKVKRGLGSFTGIRVGVSIANALSFALKIPVY